MYRLSPRGCRTIIWSSHPRVGLPHCVYTAGLLIVWQDWQAPWQSWLKALRSEKWDRYRANTCLLTASQSPTGRGAGSMAPLRLNVDSFFFFLFFPDSAALACKEPFTWLFLFLSFFSFTSIEALSERGKCCSQQERIMFLFSKGHELTPPKKQAKKTSRIKCRATSTRCNVFISFQLQT